MIKEDLFSRIEEFATELLTSKAVCNLCYHNIDHTKRVVENVIHISSHENVSDDELTILKMIAWFHDLGYSVSYIEHEDASIAIAIAFLRNEGVDEAIIDQVVGGINATRVPQRPLNKLERIVADADLFDLGSELYFEKSKMLFDEWNNCIKPLDYDLLWKKSLEFLKEHSYFTDFGIEVLTLKKEENIRMLEERLKEA